MARQRKVVLSAMVSVALAVAAAALPIGPAMALTNCSVSAGDQAIDGQEQELLARINDYRAANGLPALHLSADATRAAAWFSREMATLGHMPPDHIDSWGRYIPTRLTQCDVHFTAWAENIAFGSASAAAIFELWRNSPPHNTNMLRPEVTLAGVARTYRPANDTWYWALDLTAPTSTATSGSTWYSDGTNGQSGAPGATVRAYAVGAFQNVPYQLVLATSGCAATVAVLNPNNRFATSNGFIGTTVGTVPSGLQPGPYVVCFRSAPSVSSPTATGTVAYTLQ